MLLILTFKSDVFLTKENIEVNPNVSSTCSWYIIIIVFRKCRIAVFKNPCGTCTYTYEWKIFAYDYQYCTCCGCWREIVYLNKYVEGMSVTDSVQMDIHSVLVNCLYLCHTTYRYTYNKLSI